LLLALLVSLSIFPEHPFFVDFLYFLVACPALYSSLEDESDLVEHALFLSIVFSLQVHQTALDVRALGLAFENGFHDAFAFVFFIVALIESAHLHQEFNVQFLLQVLKGAFNQTFGFEFAVLRVELLLQLLPEIAAQHLEFELCFTVVFAEFEQILDQVLLHGLHPEFAGVLFCFALQTVHLDFNVALHDGCFLAYFLCTAETGVLTLQVAVCSLNIQLQFEQLQFDPLVKNHVESVLKDFSHCHHVRRVVDYGEFN